ncbi:MAG: signal transduction histidine kinase [Planctomycetota bacterium]|jgi:signal transduction histidine kinase
MQGMPGLERGRPGDADKIWHRRRLIDAPSYPMATRSLTVRSKLALVFFTACALTFGVGGSFISRSVSDSLEEEILTRLEFESRAYATALDGRLLMLARRTEDFASDGFVRDAVEGLAGVGLGERNARLGEDGAGGQGQETLEFGEDERGETASSTEIQILRTALRQHLLRNKLPLVTAFLDLQVVSTDGEFLLAAHGPPPTQVTDWLAAQVDSQGAIVSALIRPIIPGGPARFALAAPLHGREGQQALGWLVAWVNPSSWIFGALESAGLDTNSSTTEGGRIHLLDSNRSRLTLLHELFRDGLPPSDSEIALTGFGLEFQPYSEASDQAPESAALSGALLRSFPLVHSGWRLEVESSPDEALAAVAGLQGRIFGLGLLVALAACVLFLLPMGILTRPLLQLAEAARRIGAGEELPELAIDSNDEIGDVGRSFIAMSEAVKERTRLQERTAEDLRQRQGDLKSERDRLKAVIGSMSGGLIVLDPDGKPVVFNQAAEPVLRALQDGGLDIVSHHLCEREASARDACQACLFDPLRGPRSCQVEVGNRTFEIHASHLPPDIDGRVGRVLVCHDFTDRVNLDERMIHQERLAVLGEVAAVMAHELNNPLAAISMYNQMLAAELEDKPGLLENTEVIQRNIASCKRAIRELLDYATGATPEVDSIDIGAVLEDVAAFTRPLRERGEVQLVVNVPDDLGLAWGDELQVRQIFVNLIMNAVQALSPDGGTLKIDAHSEGQHVVVLISDDGPGIPLEAQVDIFRPFFTTKGRGQGTGLGLPTARRIAEMHGGGVDLVETGEGGSVFRVRLMQQEASAV